MSSTGCSRWAIVSLALYSVALGLRLQFMVDALSDDGRVLLEIKATWQGMVDDPSKGKTWGSWDETDGNPCAWVGVRCNDNLTVEGLDFSGWSLGGHFIGQQVVSLESLKELDLSGNYFAGLPDWIGNLSQLVRLDVSSSNGMRGKIPSTINKLLHLRFLFLQQNGLTGVIPALDGLSSLRSLVLADNGFLGPVPDLSNLTNLVSLDHSGNRLQGLVPDLRNLTNLVSVDLSRNRLGREIPYLDGLSHLQSLDLSSNKFTVARDFSDVELLTLANLKWLNLSQNGMQGPIPAGVMRLLSLESVDLSSNALSGEMPRYMTWGNKSYLDLSWNKLRGPVPDGLLYTGRVPVTLILPHNDLDGWTSMPEACSKSSPCEFQSLDLSYNNLSGTIRFPALSYIGYLCLDGNELSGDINNLLLDQEMEELRLKANHFSGDINLTRLLGLEWLRVLDLGFNSGIRITSTAEWPNPLQALLERLWRLGELRLRGVDLSAVTSLPTVIKCPTDLGCSLYILDLSDCRLEGEIPKDVFNLSKLYDINLSQNRLHGQVPQSFHYWTLAQLSYNRGLCGGPLPPCVQAHLQLWVLLTVVAAAVVISVGSCIVLRWRWRVYATKHQQDADLIATLLERDAATLMPLRELKKATANFSDSCQVGVGGFGTVYKGELCDGTIVAIKRSNRQAAMSQDKQEFLNEVRILSLVNHRHLVKLLGCCLENKVSVLVFEYVSNGTLLDHLRGKKMRNVRLSWKHRLRIAVQTADALNYLHSAASPPIFHRDVKSANSLLDANLDAKVADFGISKLAPIDATHVSTAKIQGTMGYIDPEYYTSFQLTAKSDVYSFGVVLLELISAQSVVDIQRGYEDANLVGLAVRLHSCGDLENLIDPLLLEVSSNSKGDKESILSVGKLAVQCLAMRSRQRPSMKDVLKQLQSLWLQYDGVATADDSAYTQLDISVAADLTDDASICFLSDSTGLQIQMTSLSAPNQPAGATLGGWDSFQLPHST